MVLFIGGVLLVFLLTSSHGAKDVVFVLDRSGSLDASDVADALEFIQNVTEWLTIGDDDTLVSIVSYSDNVREEFRLGKYTNKTELLNAIESLRGMQSGGGTYTFDALEYVVKSSFNVSKGGRPGAEKAVVVMTDGASSNLLKTMNMADRIKSELGAEVFTVGIGSYQDHDELTAVASDPDSYYALSVQDYIYLCNLVPALVPKLDSLANASLAAGCPIFTTTPLPTKAKSTTSALPTTTMRQTTEITTTIETTTAMTTELTTYPTTTGLTTTTETTTDPTTTVLSMTTETTTEPTTTISTTTTESTTEPTTTIPTTNTESTTLETTNSSTIKPEEKKETYSEGVSYFGIIFGLLAFAGLLIIIIFCVRKKLKTNKQEPLNKDDYLVRQYTDTYLGAPKPLSYREATFTGDTNKNNGFVRSSTNLSMFDVNI